MRGTKTANVKSAALVTRPLRVTMKRAHIRVTRPESRENGMKDAAKRASSEALAQMMAVTAMLVIASVVLYVR
jgi:hypothetical protein